VQLSAAQCSYSYEHIFPVRGGGHRHLDGNRDRLAGCDARDVVADSVRKFSHRNGEDAGSQSG